jgi:hypothetical protein
MSTNCLIEVASTFDCTPIEPSLQTALIAAGIADGARFVQFTQMSEYMMTSGLNSGSPGTIVLLRLEDWLREYLKSASFSSSRESEIRQELRPRVEEFVSQIAILSRLGPQVWFLACPSTGWVAAQHKLEGLCRTYTNLVVARVRSLPGVTVMQWPSALSAGSFEDRDADCQSQIPFTPGAFAEIGRSLSHQMAGTLKRKGSTASESGGTKSPELSAYLEGLGVRVHIAPAGDLQRPHVERILRTVASFSLTGEKPAISQTEIDQALRADGCILAAVQDRISDYGQAGLIVFRSANDELIVESMALSCTVLGKQVEYAILSALGRIAAGLRCAKVVFEYRASGRNQPMLAFLQQVSERESDTRYAIGVGEIEARIEKVAVNPSAWSVTQATAGEL